VEKLEDILTRFGNKITANERKKVTPQPPLLPDRHPNQDFFVADILDWALKSDHASMEHPMFILSRKRAKRENRIRHYEHNGREVTIEAGPRGLPTIWDKDILIYTISQLVAALNQGKPISRTVRLTAYDLLVSTNRGTGGGDYEQLADALRRLQGTRVETNIPGGGLIVKESFQLIDNWRTVQKAASGRLIALEITLNQWLYSAILAREVLTLSREYFQLGGLERRLYELARKHCGHQPRWRISLELLHKKSGSDGIVREFRRKVKAIAQADHLPDYHCLYEAEEDTVLFCSKNPQKRSTDLAATSGL
jgi:plasmid replication initiation protein